MKTYLFSLCFLAVSAIPAFSQMPDKPMGGGRPRMMQMVDMDRMGDMMQRCLAHADELGLSKEQVNRIKKIHWEMEKKQAQFKADLKVAEIDLMQIMDVKDFDLDKASAAVKRIEEIRTAHHLNVLHSVKEVRNILTEGQFEKMKKLMPMKSWKRPARMMKRQMPQQAPKE